MISENYRFWKVDEGICSIYGKILSPLGLPKLKHAVNGSSSFQIWMEMVFVSICHQTNWDRLYNHIVQTFNSNPQYCYPGYLQQTSYEEFSRVFARGIDVERPRLTERFQFIKALSSFFAEDSNWKQLTDISEKPQYLKGSKGLYELLDKNSVFNQDPVRKKSRILIHQLRKFGLISVVDKENILPAIDYHLIRLYLRTGRVQATDPVLHDRLLFHMDFSEDEITNLRIEVEKAMILTSKYAKRDIDVINHFEWQVARSFCIKNVPRCNNFPLPDKQIDNALKLLTQATNLKCPFNQKCFAVSKYLKNVNEPVSHLLFY